MATKLFLHFWLDYFAGYPVRAEIADMVNVYLLMFRDDITLNICPW